MKVGILTGGGDVPGLNPCIKAATLRALEEGHEVVGIRRGWAGLLETNLDDPDSITRNITPLDAGCTPHERTRPKSAPRTSRRS